MKLTIHVTQDDIDNGKPKGRMDCPIALAFHRAGFYKVSVNDSFIWPVWPNGFTGRRCFKTPEPAAEFVRRFDKELPVSPFSFEIEVPDGSAKP